MPPLFPVEPRFSQRHDSQKAFANLIGFVRMTRHLLPCYFYIYTLICGKVWLVRGHMGGQLAFFAILFAIFPVSLFFFLCFASPCVSYLTGLHPRGHQAQLHPQCGVRLPFSQRRAEAAFNDSCAMLLKKKHAHKENNSLKHFVICSAPL